MRRGAALPMVLLSIGLVAALTVGGAFVTRRYATDGKLLQQSTYLEPALEEALVVAAAAADTARLFAMPLGSSQALGGNQSTGPAGLVTQVWVNRLTGKTFLFVSEGQATHKPLWHKRLSVAMTMDSTGLHALATRPWGLLP